jgi:alkylated DNA nucleotide flippase Atl1
MGRAVDYTRKKFGPLKAKSLRNALAHRMAELPGMGGARIRRVCADMILEVVWDHLRPREHLRHGQVLWVGLSVDHPPRYRQRIADAQLVPVVLDLSTPRDVDDRIARLRIGQRLQRKAVRLCRQAFEQGAVLSNCDLAELLGTHACTIGRLLKRYEQETGRVVPRRATVHDVGTGVTHKRIICWKRYFEGKESEQIARETCHSIEAVDRYLERFDRVRHCRQEGMTPEKTAYMLRCSVSLVQQYLAIDEEINDESV